MSEFERGNWREARAFFERAHEIQPSARTLRGLGMVAYELQHYVEAEALLVGALDATEKPLTHVQRAGTEQILANARALIGRYRIDLVPEDARVRVDGRNLKPPVRGLKLDVGEHHLVANRDGFLDSRLRLDVRGGEDERLEVRLRKAPAPAADPVTETSGGRLQLTPASREPERVAVDAGEHGSIVESPWLWLGAVAVVAGGVALGLVLASSPGEPEPIPSTSGVTVVARMKSL